MEGINLQRPFRVPNHEYVSGIVHSLKTLQGPDEIKLIDDWLSKIASKIERVAQAKKDELENQKLGELRDDATKQAEKTFEKRITAVKILLQGVGAVGGGLVGAAAAGPAGAAVGAEQGSNLAIAISLGFKITGASLGVLGGGKVGNAYEESLIDEARQKVALKDEEKTQIRLETAAAASVRNSAIAEIRSSVRSFVAALFEKSDFVRNGEWIQNPWEVQVINADGKARTCIWPQEELEQGNVDRDNAKPALGIQVMGLYAQALTTSLLIDQVNTCGQLSAWWDTPELKTSLKRLLCGAISNIEQEMSQITDKADKVLTLEAGQWRQSGQPEKALDCYEAGGKMRSTKRDLARMIEAKNAEIGVVG